MSSMRSASSSTSVRTLRRSSASFCTSSSTRPGVPTTTCGACASEASCGPSGMPPHSTDSLRLAMPVASLRNCLPTWSASSRVGQSTSACVRTAVASMPLQQAQAERRGLAAAGRRLRDQVATLQDRGQGLRLDRGQDWCSRGHPVRLAGTGRAPGRRRWWAWSSSMIAGCRVGVHGAAIPSQPTSARSQADLMQPTPSQDSPAAIWPRNRSGPACARRFAAPTRTTRRSRCVARYSCWRCRWCWSWCWNPPSRWSTSSSSPSWGRRRWPRSG